jgi:hypothetical protein
VKFLNQLNIPKRVSTALLNSLGSGVTPRIGLEYIAVGRKNEIETLLNDLANVSEGGSVFRLVVGRYGSGKSFLLQIIRNYAMERNYVVADVDLSPERKLYGGKGQGLATYRQLMQNMSTKVRPDGGALSAILERWISQIQLSVVGETGLSPSDPSINSHVESKILKVINGMDNLVHGFDFAKVLTTYWEGVKSGEGNLKTSALKWFRGEYSTKTEAFSELGVRIIIDDDTWFDYIKLMASFVVQIGYAGFIMLIDEGVNLYKISNTINRNNNYEKLLTMFNDTMQGKSSNLGIYLCGTPQFVEDNRRGLFSYEALKSRIENTRFVKEGLRDMQSPLIYLDRITDEEIYVLLLKVKNLHEIHYGYTSNVTDEDLVEFMRVILRRIGADTLITPREIIRDFIGILNIVKQNPEITFKSLISKDSELFRTNKKDSDDEDTEDDFSEFAL